MPAPRLVAPAAAYKDSYRSLVAEFAASGDPLTPFTLAFPHENFEAFLAELSGAAQGIGIPAGFVPHSTFWLVDGVEVLGVSNLRHELTEQLRIEGGHIGYGVRPSARGRGLARELLRLTLAEAARRGLGRVLLTCAKDNPASSRVIAANGGRLDSEEYVPARGKVIQRWWIELRGRAAP